MSMDSMHLHIYILMNKGLNDVITLILKRNFQRDFHDQNCLCNLNYGFFLLSPLFDKSNSLKVHLSNLSSP
jgi:hypothetical protein